MFKSIFIVVFILFCQTLIAQNEITSNLGDFNEIKSYRGLTVKLVKSDEQKIVIKGEKASDVIVKNINGVLKITMSIIETFSAEQANVTVYYKNLDILDANEGSKITSEKVFEQNKLTAKSQEGGIIEVEIKTEFLDVKAITGGIVKLKGTSTNQNVIVNSGGNYYGDHLVTEYSNVSASTGSNCTVNATKMIDANAKIGAIITVKGDPKEVKKAESLGGYVRF